MSKSNNLPIWISFIILIIFSFYYILKGNYEFLTYVISIGLVIYLIFKTDKIYNYISLAKWGFAIWMLLHMLGGSLYLNGTRLYDIILINIIGEPFNILKYDQFVHMYCYFVITLFVYSLVKHFTKKENKTFILIVFLASIGIGAINEIIEFLTVAFFDARGVGDYFNNAQDLIFNSIGAILALTYLKNVRRYKK